MRVAVDARDLARDERGVGTYARALLGRYAQRSDLQLTLLVQQWFPRLATTGLRTAIGAGRNVRIAFANRIPRAADVVWHPWNGTFFAGPARAVATVHDVVPFAFPAVDAARRRSQQDPFRRTAQTARAIICDSRFTAAEVRRYLGVEEPRVHTVELGVDRVFSPGDLAGLPAELRGRPYVLYVGAHDAHKNVTTLVRAHRAAFPHDDVALVFTRPNPLAPQALVFDRIPITTLVALYRAATIVAVPSIYEGFGLPVLEAMASGAPVLASRAAALPEVGGDRIRYVDDPLDVGAWQRALRDLYFDVAARAAMARLGPLRAAEFTWERCAARTLDIIRATAGVST